MFTPALVAEAMRRAAEGERLPAPALEKLQQQKLRALLRHAVAGSPFYAGLYRGVDVDTVPLSALPAVNKEMIQSHFDAVVTDRRLTLAGVKAFCRQATPQTSPWYLGEFIALMTSGTTGHRGYYVWDGPAVADAIAVGFRQSNREAPAKGPPEPQRIAAIIQTDPCDATNVLMSMVPAPLGDKRLIDIRQDLATICKELDDFRPTMLAAYPYMLWLLSEAVREGRLHARPRRITSSADVLTASDRAAVRSAFGTEPYNYYCSTEVPYLAWECDAHDGLHVNADSVIVESVDAANNPVPPGRLGDKILITNLSNRIMPLVRYEMSDQVEYTTAPCPCGCLLPRLRTVAGRVEHLLSLPGAGGVRVRLVEEHVDDLVARVEGVSRYQVIQEGPARLTLNVIPQPGSAAGDVTHAVAEAVGRCFRKYGVDAGKVQVDIRRVDRLEPIDPGGRKVCRFWNRCREEVPR